MHGVVLQYKQNRPDDPARPRRTRRFLTPGGPKGKPGTFLYHMYRDPINAVASMRTKMICRAWNLVSKLVSSSRVVMDICQPGQ